MRGIRTYQHGATLPPLIFGLTSDDQAPAHSHDQLKTVVAMTSSRETRPPHDHRRRPDKRARICMEQHRRRSALKSSLLTSQYIQDSSTAGGYSVLFGWGKPVTTVLSPNSRCLATGTVSLPDAAWR